MGQVVVGIALDDEFVRKLQSQTGLEHTLIAGGKPLASSLAGSTTTWIQGTHSETGNSIQGLDNTAEFMLNGQPYYVSRITTIDPDFIDEVALNIADVVATEQRLAGLLAGSKSEDVRGPGREPRE